MPGGDSSTGWLTLGLAIVNAAQAVALAALTRPARVARRASRKALKDAR